MTLERISKIKISTDGGTWNDVISFDCIRFLNSINPLLGKTTTGVKDTVIDSIEIEKDTYVLIVNSKSKYADDTTKIHIKALALYKDNESNMELYYLNLVCGIAIQKIIPTTSQDKNIILKTIQTRIPKYTPINVCKLDTKEKYTELWDN